jgi:hypothetical protein
LACSTSVVATRATRATDDLAAAAARAGAALRAADFFAAALRATDFFATAIRAETFFFA